MRLTKIKVAGFKSFADPTSVGFPSNLTGVVGPNGCGKSNIIDAVRWVMGELSAKHLRGDSMIDVIFNGSASRKPVGTASVDSQGIADFELMVPDPGPVVYRARAEAWTADGSTVGWFPSFPTTVDVVP